MSSCPVIPAPPDAARALFGQTLPTVEAYAALLAGAGVERGLLGPREVPRLWDRHLLNCAVVTKLLRLSTAVIDIGSGAGLPGLVWAIARPDLRITLLEPMKRRACFLIECIETLGLESVTVVRGRAEEVVGKLVADVVTARAVASLDRLAGWALPLLRPGGELLALKGMNAEREIAEAASTLDRLGVMRTEVLRVGEDLIDPPSTVVRVATCCR